MKLKTIIVALILTFTSVTFAGQSCHTNSSILKNIIDVALYVSTGNSSQCRTLSYSLVTRCNDVNAKVIKDAEDALSLFCK